jgi:hypothetical protein
MFVLSFMLSFLGRYHLWYHLMLSFSLVHILCYNLCYNLLLSWHLHHGKWKHPYTQKGQHLKNDNILYNQKDNIKEFKNDKNPYTWKW